MESARRMSALVAAWSLDGQCRERAGRLSCPGESAQAGTDADDAHCGDGTTVAAHEADSGGSPTGKRSECLSRIPARAADGGSWAIGAAGTYDCAAHNLYAVLHLSEQSDAEFGDARNRRWTACLRVWRDAIPLFTRNSRAYDAEQADGVRIVLQRRTYWRNACWKCFARQRRRASLSLYITSFDDSVMERGEVIER